jgi:hypothetical protein
LALNITIQSYAGTLYYGLIACEKTVPDLDRFVRHMQAAHDELLALARLPSDVSKVVAKSTAKVTSGKGKKIVKKQLAKVPAATTRLAKKPTATLLPTVTKRKITNLKLTPAARAKKLKATKKNA